jgi:hypothetical protein
MSYKNTKADCRYFFRGVQCIYWNLLGEFETDADALEAARVKHKEKGGRLCVAIGGFSFPVMDLEAGGNWIGCKARKSYKQNRGVRK